MCHTLRGAGRGRPGLSLVGESSITAAGPRRVGLIEIMLAGPDHGDWYEAGQWATPNAWLRSDPADPATGGRPVPVGRPRGGPDLPPAGGLVQSA